MTTATLSLALLALLASSLLSTGAGAALSIGSSRMRTLLEEGFRGAEDLAVLRDRSTSVRGTLLLANLFLNVGAVALAVAAATQRWGLQGVVASVLAAPAIIVLVGEVIPRHVSARAPLRIGLVSAPVLLAMDNALGGAGRLLLRLDAAGEGRNGDESRSSEEREVNELTHLGRREGVVEEEEHLLVERAFRLDELTAWDIMTPRVDIFAWPATLTLGEIVDQLVEVPHSRVPVYGDSIDDVTGILYIREAYAAYVAGKADLPLSALSREPFFVPGSLRLTRLLKDFQSRRIHMGIVADEFGGTDGLVTLEDLLEELVGEIEDETDVREEPVVRVSRDEILVDGTAELREINYALNVSIPVMEQRSLNGFILEEMGRVPGSGETLEVAGLTIEILDASETQVIRARLLRQSPSEVSGGE